MKPKIICISGGSGSGKTFLSKNIINTFTKRKTVLIQQDAYYKDLSHLKFEERINNNFDHPESIDINLLEKQIKKLSKGKI